MQQNNMAVSPTAIPFSRVPATQVRLLRLTTNAGPGDEHRAECLARPDDGLARPGRDRAGGEASITHTHAIHVMALITQQIYYITSHGKYIFNMIGGGHLLSSRSKCGLSSHMMAPIASGGGGLKCRYKLAAVLQTAVRQR